MEKNVLIVNFNTQNMTDACIKSINKNLPGCNIYVFDNSNKTPFINKFENVTVIDNTKEKIANFTEIKERHKDFFNKGAIDNDYGSMKHCLSVEKSMQIIGDDFILMDSDILVKKNFSVMYDKTKIFVGQREKMPHFKKRVAPYMVFINVKMCKEHNIHFFDENHMFGFYDTKGGENYDTGCWFYEACKDLPKKEININQYMVHFRAASWYKEAVEKQNYKKISPERWLENNKRYWEGGEPQKQKIEEKTSPPYPPEDSPSTTSNQPQTPKVITRLSKIRQEEIERRDAEKNDNPPTAHTVSIRPMLSHLKKDRHRVIFNRK